MYHVFWHEEHWFTRDQLEVFVESKEKITGGELEAGKADENKPGEVAADPESADYQLIVIDLHEVRINGA